MIIRLKDSLGAIHEGDYYSREDLLAQVGGSEAALNEKLSEIHEMFKNIKSMNHVSLEMNGTKRYFNPEYIIWVEIDERESA